MKGVSRVIDMLFVVCVIVHSGTAIRYKLLS